MEKEKKENIQPDAVASIDYGKFNSNDKSTEPTVNIRFQYNNNKGIETVNNSIKFFRKEDAIKNNEFFVTHFSKNAENISKIDGLSFTDKESFHNTLISLIDFGDIPVKAGERTIKNSYKRIDEIYCECLLSQMKRAYDEQNKTQDSGKEI